MSTTRHEVADDGLAIFDLRIKASFRKRLAGYDKREVELYIRQQDAIMTKIRLEKEQLERQVIRLRQQLAYAREQLAEAKEELPAAPPLPARVEQVHETVVDGPGRANGDEDGVRPAEEPDTGAGDPDAGEAEQAAANRAEPEPSGADPLAAEPVESEQPEPTAASEQP